MHSFGRNIGVRRQVYLLMSLVEMPGVSLHRVVEVIMDWYKALEPVYKAQENALAEAI